MKQTLVLSDTHDPFRDKRAHDLVLQLTEDIRPDTIIFNGDGLDCYRLSRFDKNPKRRTTLQDEIDTWVSHTREIKNAAPDGIELIWLPGNHEDRLRRYVWKDPALWGLRALQWENLLKFDELGISSPRGGEHIIRNRIVVKHGTSALQHSTRSGWKELNREAFSITTVTSHCHRMGFAVKSTRRGLVACYEGGCLCKLNPEYVSNPDWQQGVILIQYCDEGSHLFRVDPILFVPLSSKTRVIWRGKEYIA